MLSRCHNENDSSFEDYGARGITVHDDWWEFEHWLLDMFPRPSLNHSLDRINNYEGYSSWNCRWATAEQQANNKRNTRFIYYDGQNYSCTQLANKYGIKSNTLHARLFRHMWPLQKALSTPVRLRGLHA